LSLPRAKARGACVPESSSADRARKGRLADRDMRATIVDFLGASAAKCTTLGGMITRAQFATLAPAMPETVQGSHFGQPDFRVRGKIFAGLDRAEAPVGVLVAMDPASFARYACTVDGARRRRIAQEERRHPGP
jgi:hypothetical protein